MRFGDHAGRTLLALWLAWGAFAAIDFGLTGDPGHALYLWLGGAPLALPALFALVHPLLLLGSRLSGWPARAMAGGSPKLAFWLLAIGLSWLPGLALFLPGLGDLAKEGTLFCSYFEALPGQPLGMAVATDDAAVLRCHFDPLAAAIVLSPLPIFGVVVTALLVTFLWPSASSAGPDAGRPTAKRCTAGARMTNCPDRSRRRWPGGRLGAPLLAFLYFAALAVCLILGGIDDLPGTALVIAPILTVLAFPVALPLAWLLQRLAPGTGQRLHRQGPRDGQSPCSMNSRP